MADTVPLFNPNDGITGRDGGPYLDEEQAREAEIRRARIEGREPDLDNPGLYAGIPANTAARQFHTVGVNNNPSQEGVNLVNTGALFDGAVESDTNVLKPFTTVEVLTEDEAKAQAQDAVDNGNADVTDFPSLNLDGEPKTVANSEPENPEDVQEPTPTDSALTVTDLDKSLDALVSDNPADGQK